MKRHISSRNPAKTLIQISILTLPLIISILISYTYAINNTLQASFLLTSLIGATIIRKKHLAHKRQPTNNTISRLEDIFIFSGLSLNPLIPRPFGFLALASIVLLPRIAQQAQSLKTQNKAKNTKEILPRTSILLLLALSSFTTIYTKDILPYTLVIITIATIYTSAKSLKETIRLKKDQL